MWISLLYNNYIFDDLNSLFDYGVKSYTESSGYVSSMTLRTKAGADTVINFKPGTKTISVSAYCTWNRAGTDNKVSHPTLYVTCNGVSKSVQTTSGYSSPNNSGTAYFSFTV